MHSFLQEINNSKSDKFLILGNGFCRSYDIELGKNYYHWDSLIESSNIEKGTVLYKLLEQVNFDFELAQKYINSAISVNEIHNIPKSAYTDLVKNSLLLKTELIQAVSNSHPPSLITKVKSHGSDADMKKRVNSCRKFLNHFSKIFSLNYDLLLYWIRCYENNYYRTDGFKNNYGKLTFNEDEDPDFLFPHGALFIHRNTFTADKLRSSDKYPILKRVNDNISKNKYPLFISEGTGDEKLKSINNNVYLKYSYEKIMDSQGDIFTLGCSFLEGKDDHIIDAIFSSKAKRVIVGDFEFNEASVARFSSIFEKSKQDNSSNIEIIIADSSELNIWNFD